MGNKIEYNDFNSYEIDTTNDILHVKYNGFISMNSYEHIIPKNKIVSISITRENYVLWGFINIIMLLLVIFIPYFEEEAEEDRLTLIISLSISLGYMIYRSIYKKTFICTTVASYMDYCCTDTKNIITWFSGNYDDGSNLIVSGGNKVVKSLNMTALNP